MRNRDLRQAVASVECTFTDNCGAVRDRNRLQRTAGKEGIAAKVINIHTIKPLDEELVIAAAKETGKIVTVEEHSVIGGLGGSVCEVLSAKCQVPVLRIGIQDVFGESGPAKELIAKYGLDAQSIYETVKRFV